MHSVLYAPSPFRSSPLATLHLCLYLSLDLATICVHLYVMLTDHKLAWLQKTQKSHEMKKVEALTTCIDFNLTGYLMTFVSFTLCKKLFSNLNNIIFPKNKVCALYTGFSQIIYQIHYKAILSIGIRIDLHSVTPNFGLPAPPLNTNPKPKWKTNSGPLNIQSTYFDTNGGD